MIAGSYTVTDSERGRVEKAERLRARGAASVDELVGMLTDPSWVVRRAVVGALAEVGDAAVAPLCDVLRTQRNDEARLAAAADALVASRMSVEPAVLRLAADANPAVVADAAQILGRRRSSEGVAELVRLTKHTDDNVAVAAIEALGRVGGRASVEALSDVVAGANFFRIFPAIDVLGRSGDPRVVEPLARLLADPQYLPEAARALGRAGERAGVAPLVELLRSRSDAVVRVAAVALAELRERFEENAGGDPEDIDELLRAHIEPEMIRRLTQVMATADVPEAVALCTLLGAVGSAEGAPALARRLDGPPAVAAAAAAALKKIGRSADAHLAQAIREGDSARRRVLLPTVTSAWSAAEVAGCLDDPDPEVRALACDTLARLGNPSVVSRLFDVLRDDNMRVVHAATAAIQALGTREARSLAVEASSSASPIVRRAAVQMLAYFGDDEAVSPMLRALEDGDARVREAAMQGLPYLEDARARQALFDAARSASTRTRAIAMRSLGHVPNANERVYSVLLKGLHDEEAWVRYYACQSLGRLAYAPAASAIAALLDDDAGQVRVSAVEALSHLESGEAHQALRRAATSADIEVRRAVLVGLGIAHRAGDLALLLEAVAAADTPTRLMALAAVAAFPAPSALGALGTAAGDQDDQVRSAAIGFLAARPEQRATEVLVGLLASDTTRERARAALLLPSEGRTAGLLAALAGARDDLAQMIVSILARSDRPEARSAVSAAMGLENPAARKAAATALAAHRDPDAVATLREAAEHDPDPEVRHICALLLRD